MRGKFMLVDADVGDEVDEWAFNTGQRVEVRLRPNDEADQSENEERQA